MARGASQSSALFVETGLDAVRALPAVPVLAAQLRGDAVTASAQRVRREPGAADRASALTPGCTRSLQRVQNSHTGCDNLAGTFLSYGA